MTEPQEIELLACGYSAECSAPACRRRATTILRYLDSQGRPYRQTNVCDTHASELYDKLKVIDRRRRPELIALPRSMTFLPKIVQAI